MALQPPLTLKGRALRLLGAREYSRAELERKLAPFEDEPGSLARALDDLQVKGFINEQRVLESVLHRRSSKLGVQRIRQELHSKGLDPAAVLVAVEQLRASEVERASEVWRKKFGEPPVDTTERARHMRFLTSRGFGGDVIRKVMSGCLGDEE
jgi:regulatory protein